MGASLNGIEEEPDEDGLQQNRAEEFQQAKLKKLPCTRFYLEELVEVMTPIKYYYLMLPPYLLELRLQEE